ncbi:MAG: CPBP family intramembrane metalloprotease [Candidatus Saccharibacteria bacterium]|nr:CPBP family intramembrane metalloprotease [Candidatus Saccharibacteria bacterium]
MKNETPVKKAAKKVAEKPTERLETNPVAAKVSMWSKKIKKQSEKGKAWKMLFIALFGIALAVWVAVVLYLVQLAISIIFIKIVPGDALTSNVISSVYQVVVYGVALAAIIGIPWKLLNNKTTRDEVGMRGLPTWTDILLAPIGFIVTLFAAGALTALMMSLMPEVNWEQAQEVGYSGLYRLSDFVLAFICLVILAPLCEEIIFRGWLYGKLRFRMSAVPAILITSVLFGIMHGQWNVGVTVFAMSVGMCIMRELTGTIWSGVLLHMIKNGVAFYFLFVV